MAEDFAIVLAIVSGLMLGIGFLLGALWKHTTISGE